MLRDKIKSNYLLKKSKFALLRLLEKSTYIPHTAINSAGIPLTRNDRRILSFKDRHRGRRAFVLGMGPSLRAEDLDLLRGDIAFACNKIYLTFETTDWRPSYYFVVDDLVALNNEQSIRELRLTKFFSQLIRPSFILDRDVIWLRELP